MKKRFRIKETGEIVVSTLYWYETKLGCFYEVEFENEDKKFIHVNDLEEIENK